jgi:hypothetical protein
MLIQFHIKFPTDLCHNRDDSRHFHADKNRSDFLYFFPFFLLFPGWRSYYPDHRSVISLTSVLTDSPGSTRAHACAALQLLSNIVVDVQPEIGAFDHLQRAMTIMFKDQQLEKVFLGGPFFRIFFMDFFQILLLGLTALQSTLTPEELSSKDPSNMALMESALKLILSCLQYDFPATGFAPPEPEKKITFWLGYAPLQSLNQPLLVPSDWEFLKKEETVALFFKVLASTTSFGDTVNLAIHCLSWLVTLKRSMFGSAGERRAFLKVFFSRIETFS